MAGRRSPGRPGAGDASLGTRRRDEGALRRLPVGHTIELAPDGAAALETAHSFAPDVVLLDIGPPEMDGCEVARRMRRWPGAGKLKIIAFTGYGQQDDQRRSREAGCDAHLVKPIAPEVLLAHIARGER
ncbi:response regulator [Sorangium sp. So ce1000]